ncbi:MAG: VCBS repeat-containing protein [Nitrospirota bacterium]|nr:VCBS repeat-containing protein [Nitrospirota bacterium]
MKKFAAVLIGFLLLMPLAVRAEKALGPEEVTSVDEIAVSIASYFPKVQGEVSALQGDRLTLSVGRKEGLLPGMVLSLWREGREFQHPVTKAVLGHVEDEIGSVEVLTVAEGSSTAVMKNKLKDPKQGDRARISPRKLALGVLPVVADRPEIIQGLSDRLQELGRFSVLETQKTVSFLKGKKQRDTSLVREMIDAYKLDAVTAVGLYPVGEKLLVTARVFYANESDPVDTIVVLLSLASKREALGDVRPFFAPVQAAQEKLPDLPVAARYFGAGDLDGDGALEYVFSDEMRLHIYRPEPSGWKEAWTEQVPMGEKEGRQFHLDVADIDGNGKPEIYVTRMLNSRVSTVILEHQGKGFQRVAEMNGFLRVLRQPGRGMVLIGQDYDPATFYAGPVREYAWSGGKIAAGQTIALPKDVNLYGFTFADFGEARPLLVLFDRDNRLSVYSGDTVLWRSEERYVAVDAVVIKPLSGLDSAVGRTASDLDRAMGSAAAQREKDREIRIPGDIQALDLDGNGKDELVLPRNTPVPLLGGYKGGEVHSLAWTGSRLEPRWTVKDLAGPVLAAQILPPVRGAATVAALVQIPGGLFSKDAYRVELYEGK